MQRIDNPKAAGSSPAAGTKYFAREVVNVAVDWLAIKNDYISGGGSYRKLAEKYGVNKDTIAKRAKVENWKEQRCTQADKTQTKTIQKTTEKISDALSEEAATKVRIRGKLIKLAENWIDAQCESIEDPGAFRRIVQSCVDLGIMDVQEGGEVENDGLLEALGRVAADLFEDGDDSMILPEESE